jgi:hypothetical protein
MQTVVYSRSMTLSDALSGLKNQPRANQSCAFVHALNAIDASDEDRKTIDTILWDRNEGADRITNRDLTITLRQSGAKVSNTATDRHRKKDCACFNNL